MRSAVDNMQFARRVVLLLFTVAISSVSGATVVAAPQENAGKTTSARVAESDRALLDALRAACHVATKGEELGKTRLLTGCTASPVYASGAIYFVGRDGETAVVAPGREMKVLARNRVAPEDTLEDFMASPAFANDKVYLRSSGALYCLGSTE